MRQCKIMGQRKSFKTDRQNKERKKERKKERDNARSWLN